MKEIFYNLTLLVLLLTFACKKEAKEIKPNFDFIKTYAGKIDNKYPLHLKLKSENGKINGQYFYDKLGVDIQIKGVITKDSLVTLNEFDKKGNQTGLWTGKFINENKISGTWSKPNGNSVKDFTLILTSDNFEIVKKNTKEKTSLKKEKIIYTKKILHGKWWAIDFAKWQIYFYDNNTFLQKDGFGKNQKGKYSFSKKYVYLNFNNGKDQKLELDGGRNNSFSLKGDGVFFVKEWEE